MQICSKLLIEKMFYYKFFCQTIQCPKKEGGHNVPPSDVSTTKKHADVTRVKQLGCTKCMFTINLLTLQELQLNLLFTCFLSCIIVSLVLTIMMQKVHVYYQPTYYTGIIIKFIVFVSS